MQRIAVLASFVLVAFLVSCGGGGGGNSTASIPGGNPPNPGPGTATTAPTTAPSSSPTAGATPTPHSAAPPSNAPAPIATVTTAPTPTPTPSSLVYVSNSDGTTTNILAFPLGTGGNIAPVKTIAGSQTQLTYPQSIAFDSAGNLYVSNEAPSGTSATPDVVVYARGSNGNAAPIRVIEGPNTGFAAAKSLFGVAVDGLGYLYVMEDTSSESCTASTCTANDNATIAVFAPSANGDVAPIRTIDSSACFRPGGIAVTASGTLFANCWGPTNPGHPNIGQIVSFAPGASGNATPVSDITTNYKEAGGIALSPLGLVFVDGGTIRNIVLGYEQTANGSPPPSVLLDGTEISNSTPIGDAVDASGVLYVLSLYPAEILEYGSTANGSTPPIFIISGSNTGLLVCSSSGPPCSGGGIAIGPP